MPPALRSKRGFVATLGALTALAALTTDMSLPAVPAMAGALETNLSLGQQIVGVFMLGMAIGNVPAGLVSDRVGRLPVLYAGMALFTAAACVAAAAANIELMLAARFLQGVGASAAIVVSRAVVRDVARGREAARMMSVMTMLLTAAPVIAPSCGAFLVAHGHWRAPFVSIAAAGFVLLFLVRRYLIETFRPDVRQHPFRQLLSSVAEFFAHRQSVFGLLLVIILPAGFMSMITISAALCVEIYGFSVQAYGLIFALAGIAVLLGAVVNRNLVERFDPLKVLHLAILLIALAGGQLLVISYLDTAPFWWLWGSVCLFMMTIGIVMPNATIIALDPLPKIAGVASSIIGTLQSLIGAVGAIVAAMIYDGSVRNSVILMGGVAVLAILIFLLRPLIVAGPIVHHRDELARD